MELNKARFFSVIYDTTLATHQRFNIGTYKEKKLHIMLKKYFEPNEDFHEVPVNGFIADICRDGVITEIETNGFCGLRPKLAAYTPDYKVRLVFPLAAKKFVSWIDPASGDISPKKASPKKENVYQLLYELVYILPFVKNPSVTFLAPLLEMEEYKLLDGWSHDRKRGAHRFERVPTDLYDIIELSTDDDFRRCLPDNCLSGFSVKEFAAGASIKLKTARAVVKVLEARGVIERTGKNGNTFLYSRT